MATYLYALLVLILVLIGHIVGIQWLYFGWDPYDVFMHIAGGIGIGLFLLAIVDMHMPRLRNRRLMITLGVLFVGIVWELFEIRYNLAGYPLWTKAYYLDTAKDLIDDVVGGLLIALLVSKQ